MASRAGVYFTQQGATGTAGTSVTLAATNYEFLALQFDGSNFRIASITPRSAAALGMLGHQIVTGATPTVGIERLRHVALDRRQRQCWAGQGRRVHQRRAVYDHICVTLAQSSSLLGFRRDHWKSSTADSHVDEQCRADRDTGSRGQHRLPVRRLPMIKPV